MQTIKICYLIILNLLILLHQSEGKLLNLGGTWNRRFPKKTLSVKSYIEQLTWKVGNATKTDGLKFQPTDFAFAVDAKLLGVELKGDVVFNNGVTQSNGYIVQADFASIVNRTEDLTSGTILMAVRLNELETLHNLETKIEASNAIGTVELKLANVDFIFEMNHTFSSGLNNFQSLNYSCYEENINWTIKPRNVVTYALEQITKRDNTTSEWYSEALIKWQYEHLTPLLTEMAKDLPFPLDPH